MKEMSVLYSVNSIQTVARFQEQAIFRNSFFFTQGFDGVSIHFSDVPGITAFQFSIEHYWLKS